VLSSGDVDRHHPRSKKRDKEGVSVHLQYKTPFSIRLFIMPLYYSRRRTLLQIKTFMNKVVEEKTSSHERNIKEHMFSSIMK